MNLALPSDLKEAEEQLFNSLEKNLDSKDNSRFSVSLRFEGLKVEPLVIRLANKLNEKGIETILAFSDFGSAALNKRDHPNLSKNIFTYKDIINSNQILNSTSTLIAVAPQPYNYEEFYQLSTTYNSKQIMFNGKLEDAAVGIGSVGRDRRAKFIKSWKVAYWLEPIQKGAILYDYYNNWQLYAYSSEGYKFIHSFESRPDDTLISSYI